MEAYLSGTGPDITRYARCTSYFFFTSFEKGLSFLSPMCLSVRLTEVLDPHLADEEIRGGLRLEGTEISFHPDNLLFNVLH